MTRSNRQISLLSLASIFMVFVLLIELVVVIVVLMLARNMFQEQVEHTQNLIVESLINEGMEFAVVSNDTNLLKTIVDTQMAHTEVYAIEVKDSVGETIYKNSKDAEGELNIVKKAFPMISRRAPIAFDEFEREAEPLQSTKIGDLIIRFTTHESDAVFARFMYAGGIISCLIIILSQLVLFYVNRRLQQKINRIDRSLIDIAHGKDVALENEMIREFSRIFESLAYSGELIRDRDKKLEDTIAEIQQVSEQAKKANAYKDELIRSLSHEVRTPLNSIANLFPMVREKLSTQEKRVVDSTRIDLIQGAINTLVRVVNDVFDHRQFHLGETKNNPSAVNMTEFVRDLVLVYASKARERKLIFTSSDASPKSHGQQEIIVNVDVNKLTRILDNLIGNAIKFTKEGGVIFEWSIKNDTLLIRVKDSGIGIDKRNLQDIFLPYVRGENSITRAYEGQGLGLSYVKTLCDAMGAEINVESQVNVGTVFTVTIPVSVGSSHDVSYAEELEYCDLSEAKAVIIDDSAQVCYTMKELLLPYKLTVFDEKIPELGIGLVLETEPDFAFIDFHMPNRSGLDVVSKIRESNPGIKTLFIAITADTTKETADVLKAGFDVVLYKKPISEKEINVIFSAYGKSKNIAQYIQKKEE